MRNGDSVIRVGMDLQEAYDHAMAMSEAFRALADRLAAEPDVCRHPKGARAPGDGVAPSHCRACGRVFGGSMDKTEENA
jgi:hypothetical protein